MIASAITDKNVPTDATDTFETMANNILNISADVIELTGDAVTENVLSGKTFYNTNPETKIIGTMTDNGGTTKSSTCSVDSTNKRVQLAVPANGYYNTSSKLYDSYANVASKIGLTAAKLVKDNTVLGIAGTAVVTPTIQYGTFTTTMYGGGTGISTTTNVTFPKSFSKAPTVICHNTNAKTTDAYITVSNITASGFTVKVQTLQSAGGNQTHNMLWIAQE